MPDPSLMTPEEFVREVATIVKMSADDPARLLAAFRKNYEAEARFLYWAHQYLGQKPGPRLAEDPGEAIKLELLARDEEVKRLRAELAATKTAAIW